MDTKRSASVRTKLGAALMVVGLLSGLFAVLGPSASAVAVSADPDGTVTGFEVEGNQAQEKDGKIDWEDLAGLTPAADADSLTIITDDTADTGLAGTSKENDPSGWVCNTGGNNPGKADILKAAVNVRKTGPGGPFLDLAFVRDAGTGDSHVNFEFNQGTITNPCPFTGRTTGDLLVAIDFPGGSGSANVEIFRWDSTITADGQWVANNAFPADKAAAASNGADTGTNNIADHIFGQGTITTRKFGEASLDLSAIFGAGQASCVSFGEVNIRSRSSGESLSSALQDRLPSTPVDLSNCGKVVVHKTDDAGNALAGATFGLWPSAVDPPDVVDGERASTGSIATCTSSANGTCTFNDVDPGNYKVAELTAPAGYSIDPGVVVVVVTALQTTDVAAAFVDPRHVGSVIVTKAVTLDGDAFAVDPADLVDLRFILKHKNGTQATTWPAGDLAECILDGVTASCEIGPVPLGEYVVTEDPSKLPPGMAQGSDVDVTIAQNGEQVDVTITNPIAPININLSKTGPPTANVGDVITYMFDVTTTGAALENLVLVELEDAPGYGNRCDPLTPLVGPDKFTTVDPDNDEDGLLEFGETWRWTCQHEVTLAEATDDIDGTALWNHASVTGDSELGIPVQDEDTHLVTILLPDISVAKTPDGGTVFPGGDATFTIVMSNAGPGRANDVTLSDELPDGIDWAVGGQNAGDCSITPDVGTVDQVLSCDFGNVASGTSRTVTVTGTSDISDCGVLDNTATVEASNDDDESDDGDITVLCGDVTILKEGNPASINSGAVASFDITVTNLSSTSAAQSVMVTDALPDGIDWEVSGPDAGDCSIKPDVGTTGQELTCDFGNVAANGVRSITVSGQTDAADCPGVTNTATVSSGNEPRADNGNNDSTASITITCPPPPPIVLPTVVTPDPAISLVKDGPAFAHRGDNITYTFVGTNSGLTDLVSVSLSDPNCDEGTIQRVKMTPAPTTTVTVPTTNAPPTTEATTTTVESSTTTEDTAPDNEEASFGKSDVLLNAGVFHIGDVWEFECTRVIRDDDPDPLPNTARITGTEVVPTGSSAASSSSSLNRIFAAARTVFAEDDHLVDLLNPGIEVVKTVDDDAPALGQTVTFTYRVTNTGDAELIGVTVVDDQLGLIGTINRLEPGESVLLTKTMVVAADSPLVNIAIASGADALGRVVEDVDDATITLVGGSTVEPQPLPRTGADTQLLLVLSGALLLVGGLLLASDGGLTVRLISRRRQS